MIKRIIVTLLIALSCPLIAASEFTYDVKSLGKIPVLYNGRVQALDSVARFTLLSIQEKTRDVVLHDRKIAPSEWLWAVFSHAEGIDSASIFRIDHHDIKTEYGLNTKDHFFSFTELKPHIQSIATKAEELSDIDRSHRTAYQNQLIKCSQKLILYMQLQYAFLPLKNQSFETYVLAYQDRVKTGVQAFNTYNNTGQLESNDDAYALALFNDDFKFHQHLSEMSDFRFFPSVYSKDTTTDWNNTGSELLQLIDTNYTLHPLMIFYAKAIDAYKDQSVLRFNDAIDSILSYQQSHAPSLQRRINFEYMFNTIQPFGIALNIYVLVFIASFIYLLMPKKWLYKCNYYLILGAFTLHTFGLIARMIIQQRPPVTNLYSSAVFVGWGGILLAIILERFYKNYLGIFVASILGFLTLIIAYHLSIQGDTLEMMQAVLDSNFWLTTHVITITLGYSGTFLAGFLAILLFFKNPFSSNAKTHKHILSMIYGIICFSLFFSFIGTVLGGIWADQSWGRFWGWDPKENGALLIVIWNAMILHAKMSGLVKNKGYLQMAVFGNIITSFSWFGVNMLGIGLHSYGFMNEAFKWLGLFWASQLLFMVIGWFNYKPPQPSPSDQDALNNSSQSSTS